MIPVPVAPENYWSGRQCLPEGYPWLVPAAVTRLHELLEQGAPQRVLEWGAGGSTLFFARRVAGVLSVESNPQWVQQVRRRLDEERLGAVQLLLLTEPQRAGMADALLAEDFDYILVDCSLDRVDCLARSLRLLKPGGVLVLDNYARYVVPTVTAWRQETYDDAHWSGRGTRLFFKPAGS